MRVVSAQIKTILLLCCVAFGLSACAVYEPAPYYYSTPAYGYYGPGYTYSPGYYYPGYVYSPSVVIGGGWWHGGGGHHWR
ncbi:hypothetical protein [Telmatospirillum siberiense]|uniref:Lipoprotein n=1 Tax=Telmatospirillum siberiense TaxID=382514 RepID=A0A2N3PXA8_9PROT|nr:hypothetical protein [Telmatospirillum siberiense]PKU25042.1 hypothetical protein CWS72_07455 [Telmatospirillum siberiense]